MYWNQGSEFGLVADYILKSSKMLYFNFFFNFWYFLFKIFFKNPLHLKLLTVFGRSWLYWSESFVRCKDLQKLDWIGPTLFANFALSVFGQTSSMILNCQLIFSLPKNLALAWSLELSSHQVFLGFPMKSLTLHLANWLVDYLLIYIC